MPKNMNTQYNKNFSKTAHSRFAKFAASENWSWVGLAMALVKRFGIVDVEYFYIILGETIKTLKKETV